MQVCLLSSLVNIAGFFWHDRGMGGGDFINTVTYVQSVDVAQPLLMPTEFIAHSGGGWCLKMSMSLTIH